MTTEQKICDSIKEELESARLLHFYEKDNENEHLSLLDFLSSGEDVSTGKEEIENLVEIIYFVLNKFVDDSRRIIEEE